MNSFLMSNRAIRVGIGRRFSFQYFWLLTQFARIRSGVSRHEIHCCRKHHSLANTKTKLNTYAKNFDLKKQNGYGFNFSFIFFGMHNNRDSKAKPNKTHYIGPKYGLTVVLNTTTSDYYFSSGDHIGFYVNICSATEYPDVSNGGMIQLILQGNTRAYFRLVPTTVRSKSSIEQYSPKQRGCLFKNELYEQYAGHYNLADCLQKCKIKKTIELCRCMPFYMPTNFPGNISSPIKCTLADNKCLRDVRCKQKSTTIIHSVSTAISFA